MIKNIKIGLAILFLLCLADMPYGYFQLVRFVGMIGFGILTMSEYEKKNEGLMYFFLASAVLINPFFKIPLGRELWNIIDVVWAVVLLGSTAISSSNNNNSNS